MTQSHRAKLGQWAEAQALALLQQHGFCLLAQNFHSRYGEIDLIVQQQRELVFVEVKARAVRQLAPAHAVISASKQRKIAQTALFFLQSQPAYAECYCRFDVISFDFLEQFHPVHRQDFAQLNYQWQWIENAFTFQEDLINL